MTRASLVVLCGAQVWLAACEGVEMHPGGTTGVATPTGSSSGGTTGSAPVPGLSCVPTSLDFGSIALGLSREESITCTNPADGEPTGMLGLSVTGDAGVFVVSLDRGAPRPVAPGESAAIHVWYTPSSVGGDEGSLVVTSGGPQPAVAIPLSGAGAAVEPCRYSLTPVSLDFGSLAVGQVSAPATVSFENLGETDCVITRVTVEDDATGSFHIVSTSIQGDPATGAIDVPPAEDGGSAVTVALDFAPQGGEGRFSAKLSVSVLQPGGTQSASVPLSGSVPPPDLSHCLVVTPPSIDLVGQLADAGPLCTSSLRTLSLFNRCASSIVVDSIEILDSSGQPDPQFEIVEPPAFPVTLTAGSPSLLWTLTYEPAQSGTQTADLDIAWGPAGAPDAVVSLTGRTLPPGTETDDFTATDTLTYSLVGTPLWGAGGMTVTIGHTLVPSLADTSAPNWTYDSRANAVNFTPRVDLRVGQSIAVTYPIGCK